MKPGGGSLKGAEWERRRSKELSLFISKGLTDSLFWRSAMSGGRATVQLKQGILNPHQAGDLSIVAPYFPKGTKNKEMITIIERAHKFINLFVIEIKAYKDLNFSSLLFDAPKTACIFSFWRKLYYEGAKSYSKDPMLIAKQNHKPTVLGLRDISNLAVLLTKKHNCHPIGIFPQHHLSLFKYDNFLKSVPPEILDVI